MKNSRHEKILELIEKEKIETQQDLAGLLNDAGFSVTQATVSRDIKQLKLIKLVNPDNGRTYYAEHGTVNIPVALSDKYLRIFKDGVQGMDVAMNILVIKTVSGMAMAVAAALDSMQITSIVGTIAGDDTIMCAIKSVEDAKEVLAHLRGLL